MGWVFLSLMHPCLQWFGFMFLFTTYCQYNVLSAPEAENALTTQIRQFSGGTDALDKIQNEGELYTWLQDTLVPNLSPDQSTSSIRRFAQYVPEHNTVQSINGKLIVLENNLLIRQSRCDQDCDGFPFDNSWTRDIYGGSIHHSETIVPFTLLKAKDATVQEECRALQTDPTTSYYSQNETKNTETNLQVRGIKMNLAGSGYVEKINLRLPSFANATNLGEYNRALRLTRKCAKEKVRSLEASGWIDERTRAVFVEYCVSPWYAVLRHEKIRKMILSRRKKTWLVTAGGCQRLVFYIDSHGLVLGNQATMTTPITLDNEGNIEAASQHLVAAFQAIVISCLCFSILKETTELVFAFTNRERRWHYLNFQNFVWNMVDVFVIVFLILAVVTFPNPVNAPFGKTNKEQNNLFPNYIRFSYLKDLEDSKWYFAWALFLWYIRGVEYFCLLPWFQLPILAIRKALKNLAGFLLFFLFIMYGASLTFRFFFGTASKEFSTLEQSITTLMLGSLGELSYESAIADYRFLNVEIFSICWSFIAVFILLTMFVSIIDQGFQDAKAELNPDPTTDERVWVNTVLDGVPFQYEGRVKKNNLDGTFNIKFVDQGLKYIDCGIKKQNLTRIDIDDIEDGVLYAVLRHQLRRIRYQGMAACKRMSGLFSYHSVQHAVVQRYINVRRNSQISTEMISGLVAVKKMMNKNKKKRTERKVAPMNPPLPLAPAPTSRY
jgi:hypothetical protein